jgi:hypothetical protein
MAKSDLAELFDTRCPECGGKLFPDGAAALRWLLHTLAVDWPDNPLPSLAQVLATPPGDSLSCGECNHQAYLHSGGR